MAEDIEIMFARRLGEVLGEMRASLDDKAIKRVLRFILDRHGIEIINNTLWVNELPKTISVKAVSSPPAITEPVILKTTPVKTFDVVMEVKEPSKTYVCPICNQNGFQKSNGVAGHMWQKHHVRKSEYDKEHSA